jgi:hypothetical protein
MATRHPETCLGLVARPPAPPEALLIEGFGRVLVFAEDASLHYRKAGDKRVIVERLIEALIAGLDAEDGDADLEEGEPRENDDPRETEDHYGGLGLGSYSLREA